ncbi:MAG: hypothetical protein M3R00_05115 [Pseudomonadota bacterium]|nr:hypothetical protein [Pseudomonadota bacterium]
MRNDKDSKYVPLSSDSDTSSEPGSPRSEVDSSQEFDLDTESSSSSPRHVAIEIFEDKSYIDELKKTLMKREGQVRLYNQFKTLSDYEKSEVKFELEKSGILRRGTADKTLEDENSFCNAVSLAMKTPGEFTATGRASVGAAMFTVIESTDDFITTLKTKHLYHPWVGEFKDNNDFLTVPESTKMDPARTGSLFRRAEYTIDAAQVRLQFLVEKKWGVDNLDARRMILRIPVAILSSLRSVFKPINDRAPETGDKKSSLIDIEKDLKNQPGTPKEKLLYGLEQAMKGKSPYTDPAIPKMLQVSIAKENLFEEILASSGIEEKTRKEVVQDLRKESIKWGLDLPATLKHALAEAKKDNPIYSNPKIVGILQRELAKVEPPSVWQQMKTAVSNFFQPQPKKPAQEETVIIRQSYAVTTKELNSHASSTKPSQVQPVEQDKAAQETLEKYQRLHAEVAKLKPGPQQETEEKPDLKSRNDRMSGPGR